MPLRVLTVFGTRPEAIKLAPVVLELGSRSYVEHAICVTGQHRRMLDQVTETFGVVPDFDLNIMKSDQTLADVMTAALKGLTDVFAKFHPSWVVVQGDTTTTFAATLAAFYSRIRVAHVEAGLRTWNLASPWPEEANRKLVSAIADLHFAPTDMAAENLLRENVEGNRIIVTGNTVIDALHWVVDLIKTNSVLRQSLENQFAFLCADRRLILVTGHRRENIGGGIGAMCRAFRRLAARDDVEIVYPVHLNPHVQAEVRGALGNARNVHLVDPVNYVPFVYLMKRAYAIITDSGGIQEEAPGLGKPVLITRDTTERPEALAAGTACLVGVNEDNIVAAMSRLLDDSDAYAKMANARHPFGDGKAAPRIVNCLIEASHS